MYLLHLCCKMSFFFSFCNWFSHERYNGKADEGQNSTRMEDNEIESTSVPG